MKNKLLIVPCMSLAVAVMVLSSGPANSADTRTSSDGVIISTRTFSGRHSANRGTRPHRQDIKPKVVNPSNPLTNNALKTVQTGTGATFNLTTPLVLPDNSIVAPAIQISRKVEGVDIPTLIIPVSTVDANKNTLHEVFYAQINKDGSATITKSEKQ